MTLIKYEIFRTVVETGSLSKAAEVVGLTQSAVSHAIASLEVRIRFFVDYSGTFRYSFNQQWRKNAALYARNIKME